MVEPLASDPKAGGIYEYPTVSRLGDLYAPLMEYCNPVPIIEGKARYGASKRSGERLGYRCLIVKLGDPVPISVLVVYAAGPGLLDLPEDVTIDGTSPFMMATGHSEKVTELPSGGTKDLSHTPPQHWQYCKKSADIKAFRQ